MCSLERNIGVKKIQNDLILDKKNSCDIEIKCYFCYSEFSFNELIILKQFIGSYFIYITGYV